MDIPGAMAVATEEAMVAGPLEDMVLVTTGAWVALE